MRERHQQKFTQSFVAPNYKMSERGLASVLMVCDVSFRASILKPHPPVYALSYSKESYIWLLEYYLVLVCDVKWQLHNLEYNVTQQNNTCFFETVVYHLFPVKYNSILEALISCVIWMSTEYGRTQNVMPPISWSVFEMGSVFTELKFQYVVEYRIGIFVLFYRNVYKKNNK